MEYTKQFKTNVVSMSAGDHTSTSSLSVEQKKSVTFADNKKETGALSYNEELEIISVSLLLLPPLGISVFFFF